MKILLNNNPESVEGDAISVEGLLRWKNFTFRMLVIRINGVLVPKTAYSDTMVRDGDDVQVIHMISGG